jgi:hypothetical protein
MKERYGKNEARNFRRSNSVIMIVSIFALILFIGSAVQPAIARNVTNEKVEVADENEDCSLCAPRADGPIEGPKCETCGEAVEYAINYMKAYVREKLKDVNETYFLITLDVIILMSEGIHIGLQKSGFKIEIDTDELNDNIEYWVNKTVGPQMYNVTLFLAKLGAISIGITSYLLTICNDDTYRKISVTHFMSRFFRWISRFYQPIKHY